MWCICKNGQSVVEVRDDMGQEGYPPGEQVGTTYIRPLGQEWKKVTYTVAGDVAVFEGCIILGTVAEVKATAEYIEQNPGILEHPDAEPYAIVVKGKQFRWKDRLVPYVIDQNLPNKARVTDAIAHWEQ